MKRNLRTAWKTALILGLSLAAINPALASGSYCACMPKPPTKGAAAVDRDKFDLGQKIFNGKAALGEGVADAQRGRLETLQSALPARVAKKKQLPALAGKLNDAQLDALEYFVRQRYPNAR